MQARKRAAINPMSGDELRVGTRGSPLALWQASWTRDALLRHWPALQVKIVPIKTSGDKVLDVPLAEIGGKGLFTKEIDEALLDGRIDLAVHSLKDVPFELPAGLEIGAVPEREDPRDAFLSNGVKLSGLPAAARIGTSSLRRRVQLLHHFPLLNIENLRGNVDTRLRKLASGEFDGIILAMAGLTRLGYKDRVTQILEDDIMVSAVGQGALGIVCRSDDNSSREFIKPMDHLPTRAAVTAERGLLRSLGGSCQVPVAGIARFDGHTLKINGLIASLDGTRVISEQLVGSPERPEELGIELGNHMLSRGAGEILAEIIQHGAQR
jgi:hydroxymethylbilane synthase